MKYSAAYAFVILLLVGCSTTTKYVSKLPNGSAKPEDYPIYVYTENITVPRPFEVIGTMHVGETPFTMMGGSLKSVMNKLMKNARQKGADAVQITTVKKPGFLSPNHGGDANFLRFTDTWESISLSEAQLAHYFRTNAQKLDPIEGIWYASDQMQSRVAILKNGTRPGRDFIAVILNTRNLSWEAGDKKADLRRGERPGVYRGSYYEDDYQEKKIAVTLRLPGADRFAVIIDESAPVFFVRDPAQAGTRHLQND